MERVRARNLCPPNGAVLSLPGGQRRDLIGRDNFHAYPTGAGVGISSRRSDRRDKARASIPFATTVLARRVWPLGAADRDIGQILQRATELCTQGLETPFAKVLEYMPDEQRLLVRAGVGWAPGTIGQVSLGINMESPAGYTFHTGQIVIFTSRRKPASDAQTAIGSGIKRAINVLIARGGEGHLPFGVLEVDSSDPANSITRMPTSFRLRGVAWHRHRAATCYADLNPPGPRPPGHVDAGDEPPRREQPRVVVGLLRVQGRNAQSRKSRMRSRTPLRASPRSPRSTTIYGVAPRSGLSTSPTSRASFAGSCRKPLHTRLAVPSVIR